MEVKPIEPITLEDSSKRKYAFMPQSDMTAIESALLCQLFVKMTLNRSGDALDWPGYVEDHRLWRHFTDPLAIDQPPLEIEKLASMETLLEVPKKITIQNLADPGMSCTITEDMEIPPGWERVSDEKLFEEAGAGGVK